MGGERMPIRMNIGKDGETLARPDIIPSFDWIKLWKFNVVDVSILCVLVFDSQNGNMGYLAVFRYNTINILIF